MKMSNSGKMIIFSLFYIAITQNLLFSNCHFN